MPCIVIVPCLVDFVARQARAQRGLEQRNAQFIEEQRAERRDEIVEFMRQQGVNEIRELDNNRFIALSRKWIRHKDWRWNPTSNFLASKPPGKRFAVCYMPKVNYKPSPNILLQPDAKRPTFHTTFLLPSLIVNCWRITSHTKCRSQHQKR